jgi:mannan endo-1,4-beta-mannosidase
MKTRFRVLPLAHRTVFAATALLLSHTLRADGLLQKDTSADTGLVRLEAEAGTLAGCSAATTLANYSGTGYVFIENAASSITWNSLALVPGTYHVTLGFASPYGTAGANKVVNVAINGVTIPVTLPNQRFFGSVFLGDFQMNAANSVVISDNWTWFDIDYIQFVRVPDDVPNDKGETRAAQVLDFLSARAGKGMLSGQQTYAEAQYVHGKTGVLPAIISEDLVFYSSTCQDYSADPAQVSENLIRHWEEGHFVSLCWHWVSPSGHGGDTVGDEWWRGFYSEHTSFDVAAALANPQGAEYAELLADIDLIAAELRKFADANVPVLWRPLHEAEGNAWGAWFWWGDGGAEVYKQLWHLLHDRLENHHGLRNLIWVYTCTDLMQASWYPGDDYVDIVGIDQYPADRSSTLLPAWTTLSAMYGDRKVIALTEFGGVPDVDAMMAAGVNWAYFASWYDSTNGPSSLDDEKLSAIYNSDKVVSLGELDQNLDSVTNAAALSMGFSTQAFVATGLGVETPAGIGELMLFDGDAFTLNPGEADLVVFDGSGPALGGYIIRESGDLDTWSPTVPDGEMFVRVAPGKALIVFTTPSEPWFVRIEELAR